MTFSFKTTFTPASILVSAIYLGQVRLVVNLSNSRVGKVDEVVSAGLLQKSDVLQVDLNTVKQFTQVLVVL